MSELDAAKIVIKPAHAVRAATMNAEAVNPERARAFAEHIQRRIDEAAAAGHTSISEPWVGLRTPSPNRATRAAIRRLFEGAGYVWEQKFADEGDSRGAGTTISWGPPE